MARVDQTLNAFNSAANKSLKVFNQVANRVDSINKKLNKTIIIMKTLTSVGSALGKTINGLVTTKNNLLKIQKQITSSANQAKKAYDNMSGDKSGQSDSGKSSSGKSNDGILKKIKEIPSLFSKGKKMGENIAAPTLGAAMEQDKLKDMFIARTGNEDVGTAMFEKYRREALRTGADVNKYLSGTLGNLSITQNSGQLSELSRLANQMSAFDPSGKGLDDAFSTLDSALKGDVNSLASKFNIPVDEIEASKLGELGKTNDIDGFISAFDQLLEQKGMGQEAFQTMMDSPANKWGNLLNRVQNQLAVVSQAALDAFMPLLDMLINLFESGQLDPFFNALAVGFEMFASFVTWLATLIPPAWELVRAGIAKVVEVFYGLLPVLQFLAPIIIGVASALLFFITITSILNSVLRISKLVMTTVSAAMRILNLTMLANPIGIVIGLVALIIGAFIAFQSAAGDLRKAFSNAFGYIVDIAESAVNFIIELINSFIRGINKMTGFFAGLLGVEHKAISEIEMTADFSGVKDAGQDFIENFSMDDLKAKFSVDKIGDQGDEGQLDLWDQQHPNMPKTPSVPADIGKVGEVGRINDSVDVASEDLKLMRELAEIQSIQNFVTLTPTVQMSTGDINNGYDVEKIITRIEQKLEEEFVTAAEGVYA